MKRLVLLVSLLSLCSPARADYLGSWKIDDYVTFTAQTSSSTGAQTDADSVPTYDIYEDETGTPLVDSQNMAKLDDAGTTGFYSEQVQLTSVTGFEKGKSYTIRIAATVGGVTGATTHNFQIEAEVDSNSVTPTVSANAIAISGSSTAADDLEDFALNGYNDTTNFLTGVTAATSVVSIDPDGITSDSIANGAIDAATFGTGAIDNAAFNVTETLAANPATGGIVAASFAAGAIDNAAVNITEILTANPATGGIVSGSFGAGAIDNAAMNVTEVLAANVTQIGGSAPNATALAEFVTGSRGPLALHTTVTIADTASSFTISGGGDLDDNWNGATVVVRDDTGSIVAVQTIADSTDAGGNTTLTLSGPLAFTPGVGDFVDIIASASSSSGGGITAQEVRDAMKLAPSGGAAASGSIDYQLDALPTAAENADAVWDESRTGHDTPSAFGGTLTKLDSALELDGSVYRFTTNALEQAPVSSTITAADVWSYSTRALTDKADFALSSAGVTAVASAVADTWDGAEVALTPEALAAIANSVASQDVSGYTAGTLGYESALRSVLDQAIADAMKSAPAAGAAEAGSVQDKLNKTYNAARSR